MDTHQTPDPDRSQEPSSPGADEAAGAPSISEIRAQQRQARDERRRAAAEWRPAHSTAFQDVSISLNSNQAQRVFHLGLVSAQRSLYMIYHTLNNEHGEEALELAETIINQKFKELEDRIVGECGRLETIAKSIAAEPLTGYSAPLEMKVCMYTPDAVRFSRMLSNYDRLVGLADQLRFAGHLKRKDHGHVVHDPRNAITRFSRQLHLLYMQSRNKARRAMESADRERFKRAAPAAGDAASSPASAPSDSPAPAVDELAAKPARAKKSPKVDSAAVAAAAD